MNRKHYHLVRGVMICMAALAILLIVILLTPVEAAAYEGGRILTEKQIAVHEAAEILRGAGFEDDSAEIRALSDIWWAEDDALNILAKVCANEAAGVPGAQWCPVWHQAAVMQGVVNRTRMDGFPDTVREVVEQVLPSGYYAYDPAYARDFEGIDRHYYELAKLVLDGTAAEIYSIPANVVYHDNVPHGPIWRTSYIDTGWFQSTTFFCTVGVSVQ